MTRNEIFMLIILSSALSISLGFTTNRTEWDVIPQLNPRSKGPVEVLMKDIEVKAVDEVQRTLEKKKSLEHEMVTAAATPNNPLLEKSHIGRQVRPLKLIIRPIARVHRQGNEPLNVILLLIDELHQAEPNSRMELENPEMFPVQGFLQSCSNIESTGHVHFATRSSDCDCDHLLRYNVISLLSWARLVKEMSTSTFYKMPTVYSREVEIDTQSFMSPQVRRIDRQLHGSWQLNHGSGRKGKRSESSATPIESTEFRPDKNVIQHGDGLWRVTDMLARLRESFFRTLLNSLGGDRSSQEDEYRQAVSRRHSLARRANFREHAGHLLEEISSWPNERGYVLVATAGADELPDALELLRRYISPLNTLIIVTSTCPRDKSSMTQFFARGPGSESLTRANLKFLHELPSAVRTIIEQYVCRDCAGEVRRHEDVVPATMQSELSFGEPILMYNDESDSPRVRFARQDQKNGNTQQRMKKAPDNTTFKPKVSKPKELPIDIDIAVRMGDGNGNENINGNKNGKKNSQNMNSHSSILLATMTMFLITYTFKF